MRRGRSSGPPRNVQAELLENDPGLVQTGWTDAPVHVADKLTPAQVRAYRLMDNRSHQEADWGFDILKVELGELKGLDLDLHRFRSRRWGANIPLRKLVLRQRSIRPHLRHIGGIALPLSTKPTAPFLPDSRSK